MSSFKNNKKHLMGKPRRGFSLVEMLMALLVASLLLAALAPVMTKRMGETINVAGQSIQKPISSCVLVNDSYENIEKECVVPNDVNFVSAIIVSGGAGGSGAISGIKSSNWEPFGEVTGQDGVAESLSDPKQTHKVLNLNSNNIQEMKLKIYSAGGSGGGGNYNTDFTPGATNCKNYGQGKTDTSGNVWSSSNPLAVYDSANKLCVTKYNQQASYNCLTGTASDSGKKLPPICSYTAVNDACKDFSNNIGGYAWRLPSGDEVANWAAKGGAYAMNTLNLCSFSWNASLNTCVSKNPYVDYHRSGDVTDLREFGVWSSTRITDNLSVYPCRENTNVYKVFFMDYNEYGTQNILQGWACQYPDSNKVSFYSTRCVLGEEYSLYSGGGGNSGKYMEIEIPSQLIRKAANSGNGSLTIHAGGGGKKVGKEADGIQGNSSAALLYAGSGVGDLLWRIDMQGGEGGSAATKSANGESRNIATVCGHTNILKNLEKNLSCTEQNTLNWTNFSKGNRGTETTGGAGIHGYGNAGNGGVCTLNTSGKPECSMSTEGKGGKVIAEVRYIYPGVGGSGGNAGSFLHIKNIQVKTGDKIKIQAGKAGTGGAPNTAGGEGGNSFVEFSNGNKYEVIGGKAALDGIQADPSSNQFAQSGNIQNITANDVITSATRKLLKDGDEVYPKTTEEMSMLKGLKAQGAADINTQRLPGGNGGINPKISGLAGVRGIPCGGYSTTAITINKTKYECGTNKQLSSINYNPTPLYRTITENDLQLKVSNYIKNYAPGATGGGGGAWSNDFNDTDERIGRGQDGMGGYVILYFQ